MAVAAAGDLLVGPGGGSGSGGSGALLARPLRLPKLYYRFLGSTDRSPLVGSPEGAANGARHRASGDHRCVCYLNLLVYYSV